MTEPADPRFADGAAYDRQMGRWTVLAGAPFIDWLAPPARARWVDIGCGSGAFTQMIVERCAPASVDGIDPSEGQLAHARARPGAAMATFRQGDAMALPYGDAVFDVAVMALVIFFVPEPARGVAEMVRVVAPGGHVAAYAWDAIGRATPLEPFWDEMAAFGMTSLMPPSAEAARIASLRRLWEHAALVDIETREIVAERSFADFDDFWTIMTATNLGARIADLAPADAAALRERVRARMPTDRAGRITYTARANAIKGRVPPRQAAV